TNTKMNEWYKPRHPRPSPFQNLNSQITTQTSTLPSLITSPRIIPADSEIQCLRRENADRKSDETTRAPEIGRENAAPVTGAGDGAISCAATALARTKTTAKKKMLD
ncbi:hypothetical protein Ancab_013792, partial [Ancistrocladus abbreviatus]